MASDAADDSTQKSLLAFVHVPKTGGTSLEGVFHENRRPIVNIRHPDQARAFLDLSEAERQAVYAVFGHMPFGLDRVVERPVTYITFLRHPVERVLSAYSHNLRHADEPGADVVRKMGIAWTAQPANFMCRMLADYDLVDDGDDEGRYWWYRAPDFISRAHLDQAKANLERCDFVGLTETYDDDIRFLADLKQHHLYVPPSVTRNKVGDNRVRQSDLTPDQVEAIRAGNRLDMELYEHAVALREAWGGPLRPSADANPAGRSRQPTARPPASPPARAPESAAEPAGLLVRLKAWLLPKPSPWTAASVEWKRLPGQEPAGPLPQTFAIPGTAYAYGAATGLLKAADCTLRLRAKALSGRVGFMLTSADGASQLSEEQVLHPGDGQAELRFRISSEIAPVILVARNHDPGFAALVTIAAAEYGPADV